MYVYINRRFKRILRQAGIVTMDSIIIKWHDTYSAWDGRAFNKISNI